MASKLEALRDAVTEHLSGRARIGRAGVTVLSRKVANLQAQIEEQLGRLGICAVVLVPGADGNARQSIQGYLDPVRVVVRCVEDTLLNRTGIGAMELAEEVYAALVHWQPPVAGAALLSPEKNAIRELNLIGKLEEEADEDLFGFDVNLTSKIALPPRTDP